MMKRIRLLLVMVMAILACSVQAGTAVGLPAACQQSDSLSSAYDHFFLEAIVQRQKGNHDAAFDLLRHCQQLNPQAPEVYYYLGQYYSVLKDDEKTKACVKRSAELDPENETYQEMLAQLYISEEDYQSAIAVVKGIYERDKSQEEMLELLFQLYQRVDDYDSAVGVLEQMEQIDGKSERLSVAKSNIYMRQGDKKAAVKEMEKLARQYPNDLNYKAMYGESLMMNDYPKKALAVYDEILREDADNIRVLLSLRTYYQGEQQMAVADSLTECILMNRHTTTEDKIRLLRQEISNSEAADGDSVRVLELFQKMLSRPQQDADIALLCASYMNAKKMSSDSIRRVLEQAVAIAPDYSPARMQLVAYAWQADDMDRVISLCSEARLYNPDEMAYYYYQGIAYYKRDSLEAALGAFQNGIGVINSDSDPAIVSDFYAVMGDILHQKGQAEDAFAAYDSCLVWKEDNIGCLNNYAYYLSERNERLDKAEQMSYKTVKAEPKNATYLDTYAWILFMQERYAEAKVYIDQALQNMKETEENIVIIEHAGDIYAQNKEMDQALSYWQDAQKRDPDNSLLNKKIKLKKYLKE